MRKYESVGVGVSEVLLPSDATAPEKWAVVACDQYTSQPEYWQQVEQLAGDTPSTLRMIYPEVFLGEQDRQGRIQRIRDAMEGYLADKVLQPHNGIVYVERECGAGSDRVRKGLVLCVDLEAYDYAKGSKSLIRATEGTIVDRIPPRVAIREGAKLELPHIMVLIDDPNDTVIGGVSKSRAKLQQLYNFALMKDAGKLAGYLVANPVIEKQIIDALQSLAEPTAFRSRYGLEGEQAVLLFAMGDGNHSLATAKAIWEGIKQNSDDASVMDSPARFALVEIVNVHDAALEFEPIHRVLFDTSAEKFLRAAKQSFAEQLIVRPCKSADEMIAAVDAEGATHRVGLVQPGGVFEVLEISSPKANLAVGTLQPMIDSFIASGNAREVDYVHGTDTVTRLGAEADNLGLYLPAMSKAELFRTVILDGALPRKTFSMGEAHEKRFYMECRKL